MVTSPVLDGMLIAERAMENPRRELAFSESAPGFSVLLKRNCSISPAAFATGFALLRMRN